MNQRGPPRKAKYSWVTDSEKYREGKVKKNPYRGVKEIMKPEAINLWEAIADRMPVEEWAGDS